MSVSSFALFEMMEKRYNGRNYVNDVTWKSMADPTVSYRQKICLFLWIRLRFSQR